MSYSCFKISCVGPYHQNSSNRLEVLDNWWCDVMRPAIRGRTEFLSMKPSPQNFDCSLIVAGLWTFNWARSPPSPASKKLKILLRGPPKAPEPRTLASHEVSLFWSPRLKDKEKKTRRVEGPFQPSNRSPSEAVGKIAQDRRVQGLRQRKGCLQC